MRAARLDPPPAVRWITRTLEDAGFETWAVGGAVRDALLGLPGGDWDLTTRAHPKDVRRIFRRTVPVGIEHGTVGVLARDGTMYEVTTFRRDVRTDGRRAVVAFAERLDDDLGRRDFTINAIAWHALRDELRDPFGGADDLERRLLRTVGDPHQRFREDYLRILRALRFAGRFSLDVDEETWAAACAVAERTSTLSAERIRDELLKVLGQDPDPRRALELYAACGLLDVLYPELAGLRSSEAFDLWALSVETVAAIPASRPYLRLAALLRSLAPEAAVALLSRLRLSNARIEAVARLVQAPPLPRADASEADVRRWLRQVGPEHLAAAARLELSRERARSRLGFESEAEEVVCGWRRARAVRATRPPLSLEDLELDGRALVSLGLKPGPRFGVLLGELLDWVIEDPRRNRRDLLVEEALARVGSDVDD